MSYADPQSVTVNAVAKSLARVGSGSYSGSFQSSADGLQLLVDHNHGRRNRSTVRLQIDKISADPLVPSTNRPYSMTVGVYIDKPTQGFSTTELANNLKALSDWLAVAGNQTKLVNEES